MSIDDIKIYFIKSIDKLKTLCYTKLEREKSAYKRDLSRPLAISL